MADANRTSDYDDPVLADLLEEITDRRNAGGVIDPEEFVARYPDREADVYRLLRAVGALDPSAPANPPDAPAGLPDGVLGDFRILREVGRGGMGVVYEAEQISLGGRRVALKVLPFAAILDPRHLQRFKNEALAAASLDHPHVVKVHGFGCDRGVHYIAMQYIDGRPLSELIRERRGGGHPGGAASPPAGALDPTRSFAPDPTDDAPTAAWQPTVASTSGSRTPADTAYVKRVVEWGIQAAEALEHAHGLGVVHRDVKPGNLLIDARGLLFVADFGLARVTSDPGVTGTGDLLGTVRYMSPEQAGAKHDLVDHRSDVYSLGITLYELLTLTPAFDGTDRQDILTRVATSDPAAPRSLDRRIPRDLETVVLKAMDKDPARRYPTAKELADDLRRFSESKPVVARRPGLADRVGKWARRNRAAVVSAAILLVVTAVVASAAAVVVWMQKEAKDQALSDRTAALADRERALGEKSDALSAAERRLGLTRQAADDMYVTVAEEWLAQQPGLQPKQRELLEKARDLYAELAHESGDAPQDRYKAGLSAWRLARIEAALGAAERAEMALSQALATLGQLADEHPETIEYLSGLAVCEYELFARHLGASELKQAEAALVRYAETTKRIQRDFPDRAVTRSRLYCLVYCQTIFHTQARRYSEAVRAADEGMARLAGTPDDSLTAQEAGWLATMLVSRGNALCALNRKAEGEANFTRAISLLERLSREHPRTDSYRLNLAKAIGNQGIARAEQGKDSRAQFEAAAREFERVALLNPDVPRHRVDLAVAYCNLSFALPVPAQPPGQLDRAGVLEKGAQEYERLASDFPKVAMYRHESGVTLNSYTQLLWERNDSRAPTAARRSIEVWEKAATDFPANTGFRDEHSRARLALAQALLRPTTEQNDLAEAERQATRATQLTPEMADAWYVLGWARGVSKDWSGSADALDQYARLRGKAPLQPAAWLRMAIASWHLGKQNQARQLYWQIGPVIDRHLAQDAMLRGLQGETAELLGILAPPPRPAK